MLQVSVSSEFRAHQGRIAITLLNKSILDYNALTVTLPSSEAVILKKQDPSTMLAAGEESKFMLAVDCMRPFLGLPEFTLDFNAGNTSYSYSLPLPLTIASFLDAIVVEDRADYMARWKSLEGGDREAQEVFPGRASLDVSVDLMRSIRSSLFPALHLGTVTFLFNIHFPSEIQYDGNIRLICRYCGWFGLGDYCHGLLHVAHWNAERGRQRSNHFSGSNGATGGGCREQEVPPHGESQACHGRSVSEDPREGSPRIIFRIEQDL